MFTSDIESTKKANKKTAFRYFLSALFTLLFSIIYEFFSNGVYSVFMLCSFFLPLFGGWLVFFVFSKLSFVRVPSLRTRYVYHSGIATLTVGCIMQGMLYIYGTTNGLINYYWYTGSILLLVSIALLVSDLLSKK